LSDLGVQPDISIKQFVGAYYDRQIKLNISRKNQNLVTVQEQALDFSDLRIHFEGTVTDKLETNRCKIKIFNISEKTLNIVGKVGQQLELLTGHSYLDGATLLFTGYINKIHQEKDGKEMITHIECYDGIDRFRRAFISMSFERGTSVKNALDRIKKVLDIPYYTDSEKFAASLGVFNKGYQFSGSCELALKDLSQQYKFKYDITNNQLRIYTYVEVELDQRFVFNPSTGLINSPEFMEETNIVHNDLPPKSKLVITTLLNNQVLPGHQIRVQWGKVEIVNKKIKYQYNEVFNVLTHKFVGTNYDNEFYSIFEIETLPDAYDFLRDKYMRTTPVPQQYKKTGVPGIKKKEELDLDLYDEGLSIYYMD